MSVGIPVCLSCIYTVLVLVFVQLLENTVKYRPTRVPLEMTTALYVGKVGGQTVSKKLKRQWLDDIKQQTEDNMPKWFTRPQSDSHPYRQLTGPGVEYL